MLLAVVCCLLCGELLSVMCYVSVVLRSLSHFFVCVCALCGVCWLLCVLCSLLFVVCCLLIVVCHLSFALSQLLLVSCYVLCVVWWLFVCCLLFVMYWFGLCCLVLFVVCVRSSLFVGLC